LAVDIKVSMRAHSNFLGQRTTVNTGRRSSM